MKIMRWCCSIFSQAFTVNSFVDLTAKMEMAPAKITKA